MEILMLPRAGRAATRQARAQAVRTTAQERRDLREIIIGHQDKLVITGIIIAQEVLAEKRTVILIRPVAAAANTSQDAAAAQLDIAPTMVMELTAEEAIYAMAMATASLHIVEIHILAVSLEQTTTDIMVLAAVAEVQMVARELRLLALVKIVHAQRAKTG